MSNEMTIPVTDLADTALGGFGDAAGGGNKSPLPLVRIENGIFVPDKYNTDEDKAKLPDGGKAISAVFLSYRLGVLAWPCGFGKGGDNPKPAYSFFAPANDRALGELIGAAAKAYQTTGSAKRDAFDFAKNGAGHVKPIVQVLTYLPALNSLCVFATVPNYYSAVETVACIKRLRDPKSEAPMGARPIEISPQTKAYNNKQWDWTADYIGLSPKLETAAAETWAAFQAWKTGEHDMALQANLAMWTSCEDQPVSEEMVAALRVAASMMPTRKS